jgi:hypothetical protein
VSNRCSISPSPSYNALSQRQWICLISPLSLVRAGRIGANQVRPVRLLGFLIEHHLHPFAGRFTVQGRLCLGQAWPCGAHEDSGTRACDLRCPGYVWTPLVEKQIPDTAKARGITEEQVKRDVLLAAQPTKEFVTVEEVADLAVYLCSDAAKAITGANVPIDGGWTAA